MKSNTKPLARLMSAGLISLLITAGCAGVPENYRIPTDATKSVIGIAVEAGSPMSFFSRNEAHVYFVRLKSPEGPLTEGQLMESIFYGGRYAYLVDADPGHYIAVASCSDSDDRTFITFFDEATVRSTITEVRGGGISFMGYHVIKSSGDILGNVIRETIQKHYYSLLRSRQPEQVYLYSGSPRKSMRDAAAEKSFLRDAKSDFKKSEWLPLIEKRLDEITAPVK
jgi:hypothetical protein